MAKTQAVKVREKNTNLQQKKHLFLLSKFSDFFGRCFWCLIVYLVFLAKSQFNRCRHSRVGGNPVSCVIPLKNGSSRSASFLDPTFVGMTQRGRDDTGRGLDSIFSILSKFSYFLYLIKY